MNTGTVLLCVSVQLHTRYIIHKYTIHIYAFTMTIHGKVMAVSCRDTVRESLGLSKWVD